MCAQPTIFVFAALLLEGKLFSGQLRSIGCILCKPFSDIRFHIPINETVQFWVCFIYTKKLLCGVLTRTRPSASAYTPDHIQMQGLYYKMSQWAAVLILHMRPSPANFLLLTDISLGGKCVLTCCVLEWNMRNVPRLSFEAVFIRASSCCRAHHYACQHPDCRDTLTAYPTQELLNQHKLDVHPRVSGHPSMLHARAIAQRAEVRRVSITLEVEWPMLRIETNESPAQIVMH